ncbi:MAG TPA: hypothetical protein VLE53_13295 [Gemmatimonadaceae bacterium]|nr:hypothetical protein [Gemmatimonadaceae bacterium]
MRRVLVIGSGGAGKTTLARRIAAATGLPLIHLDALYWHPGWRATPNDEWDRVITGLCAREAWVMDGNYGRTLPVRLAACDTVVFLDTPRWRCLWRVIRRRMQYALRQRPDLPAGCRDRLTWEFVQWVWSYPKRRRPGVLLGVAAAARHARVVVLRDARDVEAFLVGLRAPSGARGVGTGAPRCDVV